MKYTFQNFAYAVTHEGDIHKLASYEPDVPASDLMQPDFLEKWADTHKSDLDLGMFTRAYFVAKKQLKQRNTLRNVNQ